MRRVAFLLLVLALTALGAASLWFGRAVWADARDNAAIRALADGRDTPLRVNADPKAIYARLLYYALRDRTEEAHALLPDLAEAPRKLQSLAHYAIGNARMRAGFDKIDSGAFDDAVPEMNLAKNAYREALRADPESLDAKVNLELAMRLVRDLPRPEQSGDDDDQAQPRRLWTDLPGLPRGAP